jgi:hypothetical protein
MLIVSDEKKEKACQAQTIFKPKKHRIYRQVFSYTRETTIKGKT